MNCRSVVLEVSNYIDGQLSDELKLELEQHLKICKDCKLVVNQTKLTVEVYCNEELAELPADIKTRLHETLRRKIAEGQS